MSLPIGTGPVEWPGFEIYIQMPVHAEYYKLYNNVIFISCAWRHKGLWMALV